MTLSTKIQTLVQSAKKHEIILALIAIVAGLVAISVFMIADADNRQLIRALELELSGKTAYGPEMEAFFHQQYEDKPQTASAGFGYPLPAMWLALPVVFLPDMVQDHVWTLLTMAIVLIGLRLHRMPLAFFLYFPFVLGFAYRQVTPMLVGMLLIGIWALEHKRWWLTGVIVALTIAAKPQTTLLLSSAIAVLAFYRGGGKHIVFCGAIVALATFVLEPTWVQQWFGALAQFQGTLERENCWQLAPVALLLWWRGYRWGAAAVVQYTLLFSGGSWYSLATLTLVYTRLRESRILWVVLLASWTLQPLRIFSMQAYPMPMWVIIGLSHVLPLMWFALREPNQQPTLEDNTPL